MLFSSTTFLYFFLPVVLFFYYIIFRKSRLLQNAFLLVASLFFYAWGEPKFVLVMIASIVINWIMGLAISKNLENQGFSRFILIISAIFNLGLLFIFKYLTFTGGMLDQLLGTNLSIPDIALPIGISFFTFQAMSYILDVYHQKVEAQTNILYLGLYIAFFPQLIAGPIVRYETVADQIQNRKETYDDFFDGFARFVTGLSKKVLLANNFAILADQAFDAVKYGDTISALFGWLGAFAYTFQIFFDFSGYSDMAIGLGKMFGFHFFENFNYPYISTSITEFWRRWHMSLGSWFRDYVYIPLGGNRCKKSRHIFNLFVTWFLTGLWHGANYTFILWGLMYFGLLVFEKYTGIHQKSKVPNVLKWGYTMFFVVIGWVLFRAESIGDAFSYLSTMFGLNGNNFIDNMFVGRFKQSIILFGVGILLSTPIFRVLSGKLKDYPFVSFVRIIVLMIMLMLCVASLIGSSYNPFIYFNF